MDWGYLLFAITAMRNVNKMIRRHNSYAKLRKKIEDKDGIYSRGDS